MRVISLQYPSRITPKSSVTKPSLRQLRRRRPAMRQRRPLPTRNDRLERHPLRSRKPCRILQRRRHLHLRQPGLQIAQHPLKQIAADHAPRRVSVRSRPRPSPPAVCATSGPTATNIATPHLRRKRLPHRSPAPPRSYAPHRTHTACTPAVCQPLASRRQRRLRRDHDLSPGRLGSCACAVYRPSVNSTARPPSQHQRRIRSRKPAQIPNIRQDESPATHPPRHAFAAAAALLFRKLKFIPSDSTQLDR